MKLKMKFLGDITVLASDAKGVLIEVDLVAPSPSLLEAKRIWDMEQTFNACTRGRLHIELHEGGRVTTSRDDDPVHSQEEEG